MKNAFAFPKIAGIHVYIHWTFSLLIFYIIYINMRAGLDASQIVWSVLFVLSLFVCVVLHEFGHALTARRYGIKTRDITLYPIGGVARLEKMPENPIHELLVALAGPLVNILIVLLLLPVLMSYDFAQSVNDNALVIGTGNFLPMLGVVNLWLALFNLIPAFPMDGGRVLRAIMAMKTTRLKATNVAAAIGKGLAIVFIIAGFYMNPFLIFIGLFIFLGAQAEAQMVKTQFFISDLTASDALMTRYSGLDIHDPISRAVTRLLDGEAKNFVVTSNGRPYGTVGRDQIIKGLKDFGEDGRMEKIADKNLVIVNPATPLKDVFAKMQQSRPPLILVMEAEKLAGVINGENISELIMIKNAMTERASIDP